MDTVFFPIMDGSVNADDLSESDLNFILTLNGITPRSMTLSGKKRFCQKFIMTKDWPVTENILSYIKKTLSELTKLIMTFCGLQSDPMYKTVLNRLIFISQMIKYLKVPEEMEKRQPYSDFQDECLATCFDLKVKLNKKLQGESLGPSNNNNNNTTFSDVFDFIRFLGNGAFGDVVEAKHKIDKGHYAVKRVNIPDESFMNKVAREVQILAKVQHENIVRYYTSWIEYPGLNLKEEQDGSCQNLLRKSSSKPTTKLKLSPTSANSEDNSDHTDDDEEEKENNNADEHCTHIKEDLSKDNNNNKTVNSKEICSTVSSPEEKASSRTSVTKFVGKKAKKSTPMMYLYIQMELCQKENLDIWLEHNEKRNYSEMIEIILQILDAVKYIHSKKLIHRDLKPENIFYSLDGRIKVGDFGLTLDVSVCSRAQYSIAGTKFYMSPEITSGFYDYKVDIYSLGIIFFELLVRFSSNEERTEILTELRAAKYPDGFAEAYPLEFPLIQNMLCEDPCERLSAAEIQNIILSDLNNNNNCILFETYDLLKESNNLKDKFASVIGKENFFEDNEKQQ